MSDWSGKRRTPGGFQKRTVRLSVYLTREEAALFEQTRDARKLGAWVRTAAVREAQRRVTGAADRRGASARSASADGA